jgi:t-SNARE complex subunit (syntaxin)
MGVYLDLVRDILNKDNIDNKNDSTNEDTVNKQFLHGSTYELNELNEISPSLTEEELEDFEERAAIMEYNGNMPRKEAERKALERQLEKRKRHLLN